MTANPLPWCGSRARLRGFTLIELVVVLGVLSIVTAVTSLALRSGSARSVSSDARTTLAGARTKAIRSGTMVRIIVSVNGHATEASAWPDGRVLCACSVDLNAISGWSSNGVP